MAARSRVGSGLWHIGCNLQAENREPRYEIRDCVCVGLHIDNGATKPTFLAASSTNRDANTEHGYGIHGNG